MPDTPHSTTIDALPRQQALAAMLESQVGAARAVGAALESIDDAAALVARTLADGGTLVYSAAGSSGLMALADGAELAGTFGIPQRQIRIEMAGGVPADGTMPGATEDDTAAARDIAGAMGPEDIAIVLSASGTTPYALAVAEAVRGRGNAVIAISTTAGSPLLGLADIAIAIPAAPEVLAGSTRLGSGTAQKIALNMISTQAGILLGHVHDGMMVNLIPDNAKLRDRASGIVQRIAGVSAERARAALDEAGMNTKLAVLIAAGVPPDRAAARLKAADGRLRDALPERS